jgi:hypothetical protein
VAEHHALRRLLFSSDFPGSELVSETFNSSQIPKPLQLRCQTVLKAESGRLPGFDRLFGSASDLSADSSAQ